VKQAVITGITGQDGSYVAEWLLELVPSHFPPQCLRNTGALEKLPRSATAGMRFGAVPSRSWMDRVDGTTAICNRRKKSGRPSNQRYLRDPWRQQIRFFRSAGH
jgi:hypothetical protein